MNNSGEAVAAMAIFWLLVPLVLFGRPQWAVLAWLIMGNLDPTEPGFASPGSFGWINAAKGVGIPLLLCLRFRMFTSAALSTLPARLWIGLAGYAAVASLWTPFPIAAIKFVGNMIGLLLTVVVLEKAARARIFSGRTLTLFILGSLALGVIQTYVFDGLRYGYDGPDEPVRFSSFIHPQPYAAILVAFLAIVLWHHEFRPVHRFLLGLSVVATLVLNGSRTWFLGAVFVILVYCWIRFRRVAVVISFAASAMCLCGLVLFNLTPSGFDLVGDAPGRMVATASALLSGTDTAQRAGLRNVSFRLIVYNGVLQELRNGTPAELLFGHGTSSGGALAMRIFPYVYKADQLDANRTIHDEWLRALYEWGITGLVLLIAVFGSLLVGLVQHYRNAVWKPPSAAILSFLPAFLAALSTENVLAGAGNLLAFSLAILIAMLWVPLPLDLRDFRVAQSL